MKCPEIREKLADYSVELLDTRTSQLVDAHLEICVDCRGHLRSMTLVMELVETHGALHPPPGLFNGVRNRIQAGNVAQQRPAWWSWFLTPFARGSAMVMAVGALVLGLLLPVQNTALPPMHPLADSGPSAPPASMALAASIRQHALSAGEGPLTDRVAWEAVAQLVTPDDPATPTVDESKPATGVE